MCHWRRECPPSFKNSFPLAAAGSTYDSWAITATAAGLFNISMSRTDLLAMLQFRRFPAAVWPDCLTRTPEMADLIVAEGWSGAYRSPLTSGVIASALRAP